MENDTYLDKRLLITPEERKSLRVYESMLNKLCANGVLSYYNVTDSEVITKDRLRFFKVVDLITWMTAYLSWTVSPNSLEKYLKTAI